MATKKKFHKEKQSPVRSFSTNEFGALLESIDKNIKHVFEGHVALDKKIEGVEERLGRKMDEFRFEMRTEIGFLKSDTHSLKSDTHSLKEDSEMIKEYLSRIDDEIQDLKKSFVGKPEMKRLEHLETRLAHVELVVKKYYDKNSN